MVALATLLTLATFGCGQNAHLTAPTPFPALRNAYAGNDIGNGDYSISIGATNDTGSAFKGDEQAFVTIDSPDGKTVYFAGRFQMGMDLTQVTPLTTDPRSIQSWESVRSSIISGSLTPGGGIVFDKRKWALDGGAETYFYRLFDVAHIWNPANLRHNSVPLRLTLAIKNEFGLGHSAQVIMPVRFRYAFDDEAMGAARPDGKGGATYPPDPSVSSRVIAGLESVSSLATTSADVACESAFHLNYGFDFIDMTGEQNHFSAEATALRGPEGTWSAIFGKAFKHLRSDWFLTGRIGRDFSRFLRTTKGLCYRKVYGFVLTDRFIDLDLTGVKLKIRDGALER